MSSWRNRILGVGCVLLLFVLIPFVSAQTMTPQQAGDTLRDLLFDAQSALMSQDTASAAEAVRQARELYAESLSGTIETADSQITETLESQFDAALAAAESGDALALATARGQIWTGILQGSLAVVFNAIDQNNAATALNWLPLREYRVSTKFSRPGADATLALNQFADGQINAEDALNAVRADLLDTYQANLNQSLADADEATVRAFSMRRAEEIGLAAGYFGILAPAYGQQRGAEALTSSRATFESLMQAALADNSDAYTTARMEVTTALDAFRAAPLSQAEQARRAGQLLRFIALVPVEYARGVRNGQVVKDLEIQEALTFREGAAAAFNDLQATLNGFDPTATAQIGRLIAQTETQIRAVADPDDLRATVDEINSLLAQTLPAEWQNANADSDFDVIFSVLDQVESATAQSQYALAESARLEAYALLEFGIEQRLRGFAPEMANRVETLFWQGTREHTGLATLLGQNAPVEEVNATLAELRLALTEAQTFLGAGNSAPAAVVGNAAIIVFREGLEAVLILASLLASLRAAEARRFRRPLIIGGALALVASALTWWVANGLLTALMRYGERLEAVVSLIAIGVLLIITNWFFHKVYWTGWMANFHAKKRRLIGGVAVVTISQTLGLVILGFSSIYREGFETVLFLQSLVLEAGIPTVLEGVALGMVGVAIIGAVTFTLQVRLPYKKMLIVTGVFIGVVLLTMVGNTVHVMQAVGWLPITPIQGLYIPFWMGQWFGLFATWEGVALQFVAGAFVIGSYYLAEHRTSSRRTRAAEPQQAEAAA